MDSTQLDEFYIYPAERRIEERFNLDLNTNYDPEHWVTDFDDRPILRTKFQTDYKRAVVILVTHWVDNPQHALGEGVGRASVTHGTDMPPAVNALMNRWGKGGRVGRI